MADELQPKPALDAEPHDAADIVADKNAADQPAPPLKAIRKHCLWCCCGSAMEVRLCSSTGCPLYLYRFGRKPSADEVAAVADVSTYPVEAPERQGTLSRTKVIRARCVDCSGGSFKEVRRMQAQDVLAASLPHGQGQPHAHARG